MQTATENPALGQVRASDELRKEGILISPGGVRSIWLRHDTETFRKRLKALSSKAEQESIIPDENRAALEKAKEEKQARGEAETCYPGFLVAQDAYHAGYIKKERGRIYQQTVIGACSKTESAKLHDRKNALAAADMPNDRAAPFFKRHDLKLMRMLTDRGTEYCRNRENHEYELSLAVDNTGHSKIKAKSPQANGICGRFNRTLQNESCAIASERIPAPTLGGCKLTLTHG